MAVPPSELMIDLVGEILLRLQPDDPSCLVRASLVCKAWRRLLSDPSFPHSYRTFHRSAPMLGFFHTHDHRYACGVPHFVPTVTPSPVPQPVFDRDDWYTLDSRHGRVLFGVDTCAGPIDIIDLVVWEPITGHQQEVRAPSVIYGRGYYSAAVLCAVRGCNHLDCHGGPFLVVLVGYNCINTRICLLGYVYSSQSGTWITSADQFVAYRLVRDPSPSVLIGDDIYFTLSVDDKILKFDFRKNSLSAIEYPRALLSELSQKFQVLMLTENSSLGLARAEGSRLCLWSRNVNSDGIAAWLRFRVIQLEKLIDITPGSDTIVLGSAEGLGIIFVLTYVGVFTIELKSDQVRKVGELEDYYHVFPFMSFYTPDCSSGKLTSTA